MSKLKTKKDYDEAKFLGKPLKHIHNWKRMYVNYKKRRKIIVR